VVRLGGRAVAMEALVRWQHPRRGLLLPGEFVPLAERSGLIRPLFRIVASQALQACRSWREAGWPLTVAVNLSARNLQDPELLDVVADALRAAELDPSSLTLEITESAVIADPLSSRVVLEKLRAVGIRLSLDDFGTGYSSLSHLQQLPVQQLKIDRSFIRSLTVERSSAALVRSTIELGHNFGLDVVGEGVEDAQTLAALAEMGCDTVQGLHFARPMGAAEVIPWIEAQPRPIDLLRATARTATEGARGHA
nr:EAL domain-containing protein [Actinomycetota bacterium]